MNRDILDGRMERELRRRQLAVRLIGHQARTQTIEDFTGLTRHQLATVRRRNGVPTESRFRGPGPTSFEVFFSSARMRSESPVLALLYCALVGSRFSQRSVDSHAALARGERMCDVYEFWQHLIPDSQIEFEQLTLLGEGISRGEEIAFGACESCRAMVLVDLLKIRRRSCEHCERSRYGRPASSSNPEHREDEETDVALYGLQLLGGLLLRDGQGSYTLAGDGTALD